MVDRGGLNYPIRVVDEFSANTELFRKEIRASKDTFRDFQAALKAGSGNTRALKETTAAVRDMAKAQRERNAAARAAKKPLTEEEQLLQNLAIAAKNQAARERTAIAIRRTQAADRLRQVRAEAAALRAQQQAVEALARAERAREREARRAENARLRAQNAADKLSVDIQAQRKLNRELFQQQVTMKQIELLRARSKAQIASGDFLGGAQSLQRAEQLEKTLQKTQRTANGLLFTFRRLVGVLAVFTLAREGVAAFNNLVASGVRFNDTIENSTIGVAGLIATLADVRNGLGESVKPAEELDLAIGLARDQIRKLRQDSLATVATFEELLETFQVSLGPGLAAGLDLDEVREITVGISQAAAAIGVPQNQLAEEVRSLLSGTIQARTTRIATVLGITNADIRRLGETGELFDFLDARLASFADAAQKQARESLSGISTLVRGATQELLGEAAQPLFDELVRLGNEVFDQVITIRDEAGNIAPNPKLVSGFKDFFDALRQGVQSARELGQQLGFDGLQQVLGGLGGALTVGIEAGIGAAKVFLATFKAIADIVTFVRDTLGLTNEVMGAIAASAAGLLTAFALIRNGAKLIGVEWNKVYILLKKITPVVARFAAPILLVVAALTAVVKGFEFVLQKVFDTNLSLTDTIKLVGQGLLGAWANVVETVSVLGIQITSTIQNALDTVISAAKDKALGARSFIAALFGDDDEVQRLTEQRLKEELNADRRVANRRLEAEREIAAVRAEAARKQAAIDLKIAEIVANAAGRAAQGEGFDAGFDPKEAAAAAAEAAKAATTFVSTADKPIAELGVKLLEINDELEKASLQFQQAGRSAGTSGIASGIAKEFDKEELANAERLQKIQSELAKTEKLIAEQRSQGVADDQGSLVTLLRDEKDLRDAIRQTLVASNQLGLVRAATEAVKILPSLREEELALRAQVAAERALTASRVAGIPARDQAVVAARTAVDLARAEADAARDKANQDIASLRTRLEIESLFGNNSGEVAEIQAAIDALVRRRDLEQEILDLKLRQLQKAQEEAELAANGSFAQGARKGLEQLRDELPTIFEAGLELTKQFVTNFANFAASEIVNAIVNAQQEGVDKSELFAQAAGQFAQQLATSILETVIQNLIQTLLVSALGQASTEISAATTASTIRVTGAQTAAAIEIAAAQTAAAIKAGSSGFHDGGVVGFNSGGFVADMAAHYSKKAVGLFRGGRPPGIHPSDTIPAWLTPGEFVMRREAVNNIGLRTLTAMNSGNFPITSSASAEAAGPGMGMQTGGLVADQRATSASSEGSGAGAVTVVPAIVARDREMDQLTAGGKNAFMAFMRENSGSIKSILDRGGR